MILKVLYTIESCQFLTKSICIAINFKSDPNVNTLFLVTENEFVLYLNIAVENTKKQGCTLLKLVTLQVAKYCEKISVDIKNRPTKIHGTPN